MDRLRPHSLLVLLLMGYGCLAIPLGLGLHSASVFVGTLSQDAQRLLERGVEMARRARALVALAGDMERNARQLTVLQDPALLDLYGKRQQRFLEDLAELEAGTPESEARHVIGELRTRSISLHAALTDAPLAGSELDALLERFDAMSLLAHEVEALKTVQFDSGLVALRDDAEAARAELFAEMLVLLSISVILAGVFTALVLRPVRELGRVIRLLGEGRLTGPVRITGPTEIASLGYEIEWLRERLAASEHEKHAFLSRMSHELKTPLASVREGTALLAEEAVGPLGERQREVVNIMRESAGSLEEQIGNLLAFSALGALSVSGTSGPVQRVRIDELLTRVLRAHRLQIDRRRVRVVAHLEAVEVMFEPEQLRMALDNVLGNAVKFTPEGGGVRVALRAHREGATLDVIDSGPGIPAEERELVFKPFYQGSASGQAHLRGTGTGLAVAREGLEAHGATVRVVDGDGPGAHLRLTFRRTRGVR